MAGRSIDLAETMWREWTDPVRGRNDHVRWTTVFPRTATPVMGILEIDPGAALPFHHHDPVEIYHVTCGTGEVEIAGEVHRLCTGTTAYVPGNCWHEVRNTGRTLLRVLYFFPDVRFEDVVYRFD